MIENLRKYTGLIIFVIALLFVGLAFFGDNVTAGRGSAGDPPALAVDGRQYSMTEVQKLGGTPAALMQRFGMYGMIDFLSMLGGFGGGDETTKRFFVNRLNVRQAAEDFGIHPTEEEITAEEIKKEIGSADPTGDDRQAEVRGRDLMTGLPKTIVLSPEEIRFAIEDVVSSLVASVIRCLAKAPPELSQDFLVRGMYLVGGGGLLKGLRERIERETKVPVRQSTRPLEAVVLGAGHVIEHYDALKGMFMGARR